MKIITVNYEYGSFRRRKKDKTFMKFLRDEYPGPDFAADKGKLAEHAKKLGMSYAQLYKVFWDIRERHAINA